MSKPDPDPRKVFGVRTFNSMSHRQKVNLRRVARQYNAVMFKMTYAFEATIEEE